MNQEKNKKWLNEKKGIRIILRLLMLVGLPLLLILLAYVGKSRGQTDVLPLYAKLLPDAAIFEPVGDGIALAWKEAEKHEKLAYLSVGESQGYGGRLRILVALNPDGMILATLIVEQRETPSFFDRVMRKGILSSVLGKDCGDAFILGEDIDSVTGATVTSRAMAAAVRRAGRAVAVHQLGRSFPVEAPISFRPSRADVIVLVVLSLTLLASLRRFSNARSLRWITLLVALIGLGFMVNRSISLISVNRMLTGNWPSFHAEFHFYLLLVFLLVFLLLRGKNPYCDRICPFGAAQECLALIGGGSLRLPAWLSTGLLWLQRLLALVLIGSALIYLNPSWGNYEVSALLFSFFGPSWQFALLALFLALSLFIRRPWCRALCPVRPVFDTFLALRSQLRSLLKGRKSARNKQA